MLFNDGHVLKQWSETVAVHRRMIYGSDDTVYDDHIITGDECGQNFLTFILGLSTAAEQVVACALVTQRALVRSPVGTGFLGEVFFGVFPPL